MKLALKQANRAKKINEVPIGAIIVHDKKVISKAYNKKEIAKNPLYHAEILAINDACKRLNNWRLSGCTIYVTLEPCPMCAGAILNSRIDRVVFGAYDLRCGAFSSTVDLNSISFFKRAEVVGGILENESSALLKEFFKNLRDK